MHLASVRPFYSITTAHVTDRHSNLGADLQIASVDPACSRLALSDEQHSKWKWGIVTDVISSMLIFCG